MGRELKFRVWDVKGNQFWDDSLGDWKIEFLSGKKLTLIVLEETFSPYGEQEFYWRDVENVVFQQFTGLKDRNGKEIYEGDIVKSYNEAGGWEIDVVEFKKGRFVLHDIEEVLSDIWIGDEEFETLEVIGNIYENPELLEEKDE